MAGSENYKNIYLLSEQLIAHVKGRARILELDLLVNRLGCRAADPQLEGSGEYIKLWDCGRRSRLTGQRQQPIHSPGIQPTLDIQGLS